jgi:hypothetical protein
MIGRRMANIIKRFARYRDDMRLANFQRVRGLDVLAMYLMSSFPFKGSSLKLGTQGGANPPIPRGGGISPPRGQPKHAFC